MGRQSEKRKRQVVSARKRVTEHQSGMNLTSISVPEGVSLWQIKKAGTYRFDIIPYVCGKGNPHAEEGELYFERTFHVHRGIGPDGDSYSCPNKNQKKPCPICEFRAKMARDPDADEKVVKDLATKERQLWNLIDLSEPDKGVQLWEYSYHLFGKQLDAKIRAGDEQEYDLFADIEEGLTIKATFEEEKFGSFSYFKVSDIEFKPRRKPYDESIIETCTCLDDVPKILPYAKLKEIFLQAPADEEPEEEDDDKPAPKKPGKPSKKPDPEEEEDEEEEPENVLASDKGIKVGSTVEHSEFGRCKVVHISGDETSLRIEDADGEVHKAIDPADCTLVGKSGAAKPAAKTPPAKPAPKPAPKKGKQVELDEDDEDDIPFDEEEEEPEEDDDEEPAPKRKPGRPPSKPAAKTPPAKPGKKPAKEEEEDEDDWDDGDDD